MKRRMNFNELFSIQNNMISPRVVIYINGVTMSPGISFGGGVSFGGIDLTKYMGKDFEVEIDNGVHKITGVYNF